LEEKMDNTRKSNLDFSTLAWGAIFILWGITGMFTSLPEGIGSLGLGFILLGINLARSKSGLPANGFSTTLGILALLLGIMELASQYLHLSFELPIFPILMIALGLILLGSALKGGKNHD
jgi:hypothetical protein